MNKLAHVAVCNTTKDSFQQINQYLDHSMIHLYKCESIEELKQVEAQHQVSLIIIDHQEKLDRKIDWNLRFPLLVCVFQATRSQCIRNVCSLLWIHGISISWIVLDDWMCGCYVMPLVQ
mgnify:CR=1 FL=1